MKMFKKLAVLAVAALALSVTSQAQDAYCVHYVKVTLDWTGIHGYLMQQCSNGITWGNATYISEIF